MSDVHDGVVELIGRVTDLPADRLGADVRFADLGDWTSYTALRLLTALEDRFGVRLDLERYFAVHDVGGLVAEVSRAAGVTT
ncbi:acyl carrier protein [Actinosynnema sp. NPDC020468]|uniref:acyl carrier protein n=1 Tax=Actinosynnema sp. NPDC020468 TaxID=3154488 RepID=UPI0033DA6700